MIQIQSLNRISHYGSNRPNNTYTGANETPANIFLSKSFDTLDQSIMQNEVFSLIKIQC